MKKLSKRKMYQKRRKKEKLEQRKKLTQSVPHGNNAVNCYKYRNENDTKKHQRYPTNKNLQQNFSLSPITSYSQSLQLWWRTYCSALEFHTKQNAWRADDQENQLMLLKKYANDYETSSEEEEETNDVYEESDNESIKDELINNSLDEEYMKFLAITYKHQEELRLKKAEDNKF